MTEYLLTLEPWIFPSICIGIMFLFLGWMSYDRFKITLYEQIVDDIQSQLESRGEITQDEYFEIVARAFNEKRTPLNND